MKKINVTASEMMELRNQGMSNYDIAKSLDISYATVLRCIGKQGGGKMERLEAFKDKPVEKKQTEAPVFVPYMPKPVHETYVIGKNTIISINYEEKLLSIDSVHTRDDDTTIGGVLFFPFEDIPEITQFFAWAMRERMTEGGANAE